MFNSNTTSPTQPHQPPHRRHCDALLLYATNILHCDCESLYRRLYYNNKKICFYRKTKEKPFTYANNDPKIPNSLTTAPVSVTTPSALSNKR